MFDHPSFDGHEALYQFNDSASGLKAIIAIHSTKLGPSAGGCRMLPYESTEVAMTDVLRLSQGMSYKSAMAELNLGGGKAVIIGDSAKEKTPELMQAFGRAVESLNGSYYTAGDIGIDPPDAMEMFKVTKYVAMRTSGPSAGGDSAPVTAEGLKQAIEVCLERVLGSGDLAGRTVAIQGVGAVGGSLCRILSAQGTKLVVTDSDSEKLERVAEETNATIVAPDEIYDVDADVFSPNAIGAILNEQTIGRLKAKIIAGGANNQLSTPHIGELLRQQGVLYAPDYLVNAGGIINVASEVSGNYNRDWVMRKLSTIPKNLKEVFEVADETQQPTNLVVDEIARKRLQVDSKY